MHHAQQAKLKSLNFRTLSLVFITSVTKKKKEK